MNSYTYEAKAVLDTRAVERFCRAGKAALAFVVALCSLVLLAWQIPSLASALPAGWAEMQATTALNLLLLGAALALSRPEAGPRQRAVSRLFAVLCLGLCVAGVVELLVFGAARVGPALVADTYRSHVVPTSLQSLAGLFLLAAAAMVHPRRRDWLGHLLDLALLATLMLCLLFAAGYFFNAIEFVRLSPSILLSPQTLLSIGLLFYILAVRRAPFGSYAILVQLGIAGDTARIALPFGVVITYLIVLGQARLVEIGQMAISNAAAVTAVLSGTGMILIVLLLARRISLLEIRLRDVSLRDELTRAYNLRGLKLHGRQKLLEARRSQEYVSVLYVDVDGLKQVNDTLGHESGSELICEVVQVLRDNIRESDVLARIGGDEFAVLANGSESECDVVIERLNLAQELANADPERRYPLSFSLGRIVQAPTDRIPLEELLSRADNEMYKVKQARKTAQAM